MHRGISTIVVGIVRVPGRKKAIHHTFRVGGVRHQADTLHRLIRR